MSSKLILSYADYGTPMETSTVAVEGTTITAAVHDAVKAQMTALAEAIDAITLGTRYRTQYLADKSETVPVRPASAYAQRENKWLVRFHTSGLGEKGSCEIPCADLTKLDPDTDGRADLTDPDMAAFKTAFEAYVKVGAESVVVDEVVFVARNI